MDDAERVPIDIGYEVASDVAAQPSDPRTTVREDGTVLIDILVPQPCEPDPSTGEEIVVCAAAPDDQAPVLSPPTAPTSLEELEEALTATVGPFVITPFGVRLKF